MKHQQLKTTKRYLWAILFIGVIIRLIPILTENFFFHFDSARDWLWVRNMVLSQKPILVGPLSSLQGVFYGPLTYYLLAIFFILFSGHPIGGSIYALMTNLTALVIFFKFLQLNFGNRVTINEEKPASE